MFSGIIENVGRIVNINILKDSREFSIYCPGILEDIKIGDSVSVNGVCLTVKEIFVENIKVDVIKETLQVTNLGSIDVDEVVNLERALKYGDRVGGHFIQGHIDCLGFVKNIDKTSDWTEIEFELDEINKKYCIHKGSIAIDGVSLTIARITDYGFKVALIPHTLDNTILSSYKTGFSVNIETDMVGKYIENFSGLK